MFGIDLAMEKLKININISYAQSLCVRKAEINMHLAIWNPKININISYAPSLCVRKAEINIQFAIGKDKININISYDQNLCVLKAEICHAACHMESENQHRHFLRSKLVRTKS